MSPLRAHTVPKLGDGEGAGLDLRGGPGAARQNLHPHQVQQRPAPTQVPQQGTRQTRRDRTRESGGADRRRVGRRRACCTRRRRPWQTSRQRASISSTCTAPTSRSASAPPLPPNTHPTPPRHQTPIEETLEAIDELAKAGKIVEFGLSNFPAWKVVDIWHKCAAKGMVRPTVFQGWCAARSHAVTSDS